MTRLFNDVDLHAFVDGQVGPDRRKAMMAYLQGAPEDAARVDLWSGQNAAIRALFAGPETEPVPLWLTVGQIASGQDRLVSLPRAKARPAARQTSPSRSRSILAAPRRAAALAVVVAFLAGVAVSAVAIDTMQGIRPLSFGVKPTPRDVLSLARSAYSLYAQDPDHPVEMIASGGGALRSWLESRVGRSLPIPNLTKEGWVLRGGRIAEGPESPAAVLVYERAGERLMLYVTRTSQTLSDVDGPAVLPALAWSDDGLAYALVTGNLATASTDLEPLRELVARAVRN